MPARISQRSTTSSLDGSNYLVLFDRVQTKPAHGVMYVFWQLPDHLATPDGLVGARLITRMGSRVATPDDLPTSHLRVIPERDPDFDRLFGPRQHTESINNHLQQTLFQQKNKRASSFGVERQRLDHLGYALMVGLFCALAWSERTSSPLEGFLRTEPPGVSATGPPALAA